MRASRLALLILPLASLLLAACEDVTPAPAASDGGAAIPGGIYSPTSEGAVPTIPGGIILPDSNGVTPAIISDGPRLAATDTPSSVQPVPAGDQSTPISVQTVPAGDQAVVVYVVDGDTIDIEYLGSSAAPTRVRYIGVNTTEHDQSCFTEGAQANSALVVGQILTLVRDVSDTDRYGRILRYVYAGQTLVNAELVREGWAEAVDYPPDTLNAPLFHSLADAAKAAGLGCWPTGMFNH
jgi:micrococcal nuclease